MKYFWMLLALGLVGGGVFYIVDNSHKEQRAEAYRRAEIERKREEERLEKQRQEDERIRKERMEAVAKEDAVRLLMRFVDREKRKQEDIVEECKIKLQMVDVDQQSLSDELVALEEEAKIKAADAKRRNVKRRDLNERVDAYLSSPTMNRLAATYLGEDLMATRAKFRSDVGNLVRMSDEKTRRYAENRKKYQQAIKESDEKVAQLTDEATRQLEGARARLGSNVDTLRAKAERYRSNVDTLRAKVERHRKNIEKLEKRARATTLNMKDEKDLETWRMQLDIAEAQLASAEATAGLGAANKAHLDVTVAETAARRTADTATNIRIDDDNAVEAEMNREMAIFNRAAAYEQGTLDRIRDAMQQHRAHLADKMAMAEKKLKYLDKSVLNIDFLDAQEVEELRRKIAQKSQDGISLTLED